MRAIDLLETEYDFVIIGSGFGGSVSALRLSEKGYKVLVIEKGKWYRPEDFPQTNWQMSRWLWVPALKWTGIMRLSFFRHLNILSGSGVGGARWCTPAPCRYRSQPFSKPAVGQV